jgi:hypothetical protein
LDLGPLALGSYGVTGRAEGFLERAVEAWTLGPETPVLELTLQRARSLTVRVQGEDGGPLVTRAVTVRAEDGWSATVDETALGSAAFRTPLRPLVVEAEVGTRTYRVDVGATATEALVSPPAHALLRVRLDDPPALQWESGTLALRLREAEGQGALELKLWYLRDAAGPLELETPLIPGAYELEVDLVERPDEGWEWDPSFVRPLARRSVVVEGDQTVDVGAGG